MNEDDLYVEISDYDYYYKLKDKSGYYKVIGDYRIYYYKNNQHHRLDGPAWIDNYYNYYDYFINDKQYTKEEYYQHQDIIQYRLQKFQELIK